MIRGIRVIKGRLRRCQPLGKQVVKARIRKTMSHRVSYALRGRRFVVRSDEKLIAFLELERITHESALSALLGDDTH